MSSKFSSSLNKAVIEFANSGLSRFATVDWTEERQRRPVMASLVNGVYLLEDDRLNKRQGCQALATPWYQSFGFQLVHALVDDPSMDNSSSIYGAVYRYKPNPKNSSGFQNYYDLAGAPKYVIAFRGTSLCTATGLRDLKLVFDSYLHKLHDSTTFLKTVRIVDNMVCEKGAENIWLAGHSMGATIAALLGVNLASMGIFLESYLFNPIFSGNNFGYRRIVWCKQERQQSAEQSAEDLFNNLSEWRPNLFLNPSDFVCSGYCKHFEYREKIERFGLHEMIVHMLDKLVMNASVKYCSEHLYLIQSARVTTSSSPAYHNLDQWYSDETVFDSRDCQPVNLDSELLSRISYKELGESCFWNHPTLRSRRLELYKAFKVPGVGIDGVIKPQPLPQPLPDLRQKEWYRPLGHRIHEPTNPFPRKDPFPTMHFRPEPSTQTQTNEPACSRVRPVHNPLMPTPPPTCPRWP